MRIFENCVFFVKSLSAIFSCYLVTGSTEAPRRRLDIGGSPGLIWSLVSSLLVSLISRYL